MQAIDEHNIHNTMSIYLAMLVPAKKQPTNVSQFFPVENDLSTNLYANGRKLQVKPSEFIVDQIVSHVDSKNDLRYWALWYEYLSEHETLSLAEHMPQHFIEYFLNGKSHGDKLQLNCLHNQ